MICDTCIHKEVCYENAEDRKALKHCSDYFNYAEELEKIKEEIRTTYNHDNWDKISRLEQMSMDMAIIDNHIKELKGEQGV